jgi:hypothetical protein
LVGFALVESLVVFAFRDCPTKSLSSAMDISYALVRQARPARQGDGLSTDRSFAARFNSSFLMPPDVALVQSCADKDAKKADCHYFLISILL